jgi:hypothetical protein
MDISSVSWLAVIVAAVAAWLFGAAWYMGLSKPWMAAAKIDPAAMKPSATPFIVSFIAEILIALVMSALIGTITSGEMGMAAGLSFGFIFWLGFVATTLAVNHRYQGFGWTLTIIDAGHWLGVLLIIGAIVGWWGTPVAS